MPRPTPLLAAALLLAASAADAHALLKKASPPVGGTVHAAPAELSIVFAEAVEPRFSTIAVRDAGGARVDAGDPHAAQDDGRRLAVGLKPLAPGAYTVEWRAVSVDAHTTQGRYSFTVAR